MKDSGIHSLIIGLIVVVVVIQVASSFVLFGTLSSYRPSNNSVQHQNSVGYITIQAMGSATAPPSQGVLYLTAQGNGKTAAAATANLSSTLSAFNASISRYINGNWSMVKTTYYNLYNNTHSGTYPRYSYYGYNGFIASEELEVDMPNVQNVSKAIGALSSINNISVTSAQATLSDAQITKLRGQAFSQALQNATSQASLLTGNATLTAQNITVDSYNFYPLPYALGTGAVSASSNKTINPSFYSGTTSITESITVTFSYNRK
ncbi:MAG: SIMPL domain-containing protein [Candidatus Micrarchaeota archaeon]|nr:SIMPL domain-containing protein [Candidatus Micrarchaeota archaeon]